MPSAARDIPSPRPGQNGSSNVDLVRTVSNSFGTLDLSTSPTATFHSPTSSYTAPGQRPSAKQLKPFHTQDIRVLLLENVNQTGQSILKGQGYQVETLKSSLPEDQLIEKMRCVSIKAASLFTNSYHTGTLMSSASARRRSSPRTS